MLKRIKGKKIEKKPKKKKTENVKESCKGEQ